MYLRQTQLSYLLLDFQKLINCKIVEFDAVCILLNFNIILEHNGMDQLDLHSL
jgi:hypothetical protein